MCIWDLQCFHSFRNCCLFCTFWLIRNFYCGEAHHANYTKHSFNLHFQHCAHCVYYIYSILKVFEMAVCFAHFGIFEIFTDSHHLWWTLFKSSFQTLRTVCIWDLQCFETFRNCCLLCTFWHIRNFYCGEGHHANYTKHSLNHHLQHCAHCAYDIYSICKVFEIAVCFAHFVVFEIWTPLAMANVVQIIISKIAHSVYMRFTVFSKFSKLRFVLHILAYSKFLLRWGASFQL